MAYYVYMMTNKYNRVIYTGVTGNLMKRVYEHRNHLLKDSFTARYNITKLVYFETTGEVRSALEREKQIKNYSRARKVALIESQNPTWEDQYLQLLQE